MDINEQIQKTIDDNPVVIFMKGTPEFPQCGFSKATSEALKACEVEFAYVDVLAEPDVRANLPAISNWPTFPQIFIKGELVGGCDIALDLYQKGELKTMAQAATSEAQ